MIVTGPFSNLWWRRPSSVYGYISCSVVGVDVPAGVADGPAGVDSAVGADEVVIELGDP